MKDIVVTVLGRHISVGEMGTSTNDGLYETRELPIIGAELAAWVENPTFAMIACNTITELFDTERYKVISCTPSREQPNLAILKLVRPLKRN